MDISTLRALLEAHFCAQAGIPQCTCSVRELPGWRPYSRLFRAVCTELPYPLFVKRCVQVSSGSVDGKSARTQFLGLQEAWRRSGRDAPYGVPEPLLLLADEGLVVTEWVDAPSLTQRLRTWNAGSRELCRGVAQAAQWLRWFHADSKSALITIDTGDLVKRLGEGDAGILRDAIFKKGCRILEVTSARIGEVPTARSRLHGDYKADNVLVDSVRAVAIDLQPDYCNSVLFDVASFLNHMALLAWHPKAWRVALRHRQLVDCFMRNYFEAGVDVEIRGALLWVRLFNVLGAWLDSIPETPSALRRTYAHFCYRRLVSALTRELGVFVTPASGTRE